MGYKLITFDFTGTLMRFRKPPTIQYEKVASLYGIEIKNKKDFHDNFKTAFKAANKEHPNFGANTNLHWYACIQHEYLSTIFLMSKEVISTSFFLSSLSVGIL
jgi:FMN phosphatase YigB (HAD superfamily)